jgi:peptide deformylase
MVDTLRDAGGVGLAANQVNSLRRVIVIQLPDEDETARIYINPEIVHREGEREIEEGCLSIPGYKAYINRSVWVKFSALDHMAMQVKLKADELLSQVLEHEVDHLNGILYVDHMESHQKLIKIDPDSEVDLPHTDSGPDEPVGRPRSDSTDGLVDTKGSGRDARETPASLMVG